MQDSGTTPARRPGPTGLVLILSLLVAALLAEGVLRASGRQPWRARPLPTDRDTSIHELDDRLGWTNRPGRHTTRLPEAAGGIRIEVGFAADGSRFTGATPRTTGPEVLLLGGSYMEGWALGDEETLGWRLQQRFPDTRIVNHGVAGWGTYQSLLRLEDRLAAPGPAPALVIYGFMLGHEMRNTAPSRWMEILTAANPSVRLALPYATLAADGSLRHHPPTAFTPWPLSQRSAALSWVQRSLSRLRTRARSRDRTRVTEHLIGELGRRSAAHGASFLLTFLEVWPEEEQRRWKRAAEAQGVRVRDCTHPNPFASHLRVPGDEHPNAEMNAWWERCLAPEVKRVLRSARPVR